MRTVKPSISRICDCLECGGPMTMREIADRVGLSLSRVACHLQMHRNGTSDVSELRSIRIAGGVPSVRYSNIRAAVFEIGDEPDLHRYGNRVVHLDKAAEAATVDVWLKKTLPRLRKQQGNPFALLHSIDK